MGKQIKKTLIYSIYTHVHICVSNAPLSSLSYEGQQIHERKVSWQCFQLKGESDHQVKDSFWD